MKLGVQRFMEQVQALSDEDREKEMKELENDMGLQEDERKAFKELISFVIKGAKPEAEGDAELALMAQAQKKVDKLNDVDKKRLEATMVSQFGEEQTRKIFETGKNIEKEAKIKKAIASSGKV
uniref:Uncharacterized protein n=1 Tax=Branchiostoma floridae TaxID=7739 RepID=C3ZQY5_BRAFL|eukprot:XP_002589015.1 hypothetical protein BRAFLDRAFT_87488 [Branchiostoma floridae]